MSTTKQQPSGGATLAPVQQCMDHGECFGGKCIYPAPQPAQQEPVAWVPYLSDRADGVKGHYAIARWNPRGYREVWNLRRHEWGAYSDDVLSLEEADTLLRLITIPTRQVTSPEPEQQEPVVRWDSDGWGDLLMDGLPDGTLLYTSPPAQRTWVGLTDGDLAGCDEFEYKSACFWEAKLKAKNSP